jgi:hypothetical protein
METYGKVQVKLHLLLVVALDKVKVSRIFNGQGSEKAQRQSGHNKSCPSVRHKGIWRNVGVDTLDINFGRRLEELQNQGYLLHRLCYGGQSLEFVTKTENYSTCSWKKVICLSPE